MIYGSIDSRMMPPRMSSAITIPRSTGMLGRWV